LAPCERSRRLSRIQFARDAARARYWMQVI
jgi:hypothetical protein